jgi:molecular chaperone GrpE
MTEQQNENENSFIDDEIEASEPEIDILTEGEAAEIGPEQQQEIEMLREQLVEVTAQSEEYLDGWQRARADFANYRKRVEREQADTYRLAAANVLKRFLEVLDDMDLALENMPQDNGAADFSNGVELIHQKLLAILEKEGVTRMELDRQEFDPNLHEAISSEDSQDHESGEIIAVVKNGYMLSDRVLRPAMVRVAR